MRIVAIVMLALFAAVNSALGQGTGLTNAPLAAGMTNALPAAGMTNAPLAATPNAPPAAVPNAPPAAVPNAPPAAVPNAPPAAAPPAEPPPVTAAPEKEPWKFSGAVYTYSVPDDHDYLQPTITADKGLLHFEARYNYEALDTGSLWAGLNFSGGEEFQWEITPMIGGVFGDTKGIAPGYKGSLRWRMFNVYSEGEYLFDSHDSSDSFFYNWSEFAISPAEWLRFGIVTQHTRAYETDLNIQRGLLLGVAFKNVSLTSYVFNLDESHPTVVFAFGAGF